MTAPDAEVEFVGRGAFLASIEELLAAGRSVLLVGPAGIGKSALIRSLTLNDVMVVDPFEHLSVHHAARVRRAMSRGTVVVGAAQSLNRVSLGKVGRIMWMFTTLRVPPLPAASMRRLLKGACAAARIPASLVTLGWTRDVAKMAKGRPGVALTVVQHAAAMCDGRRLPAPAAAYLDSEIQIESRRQAVNRHLGKGR